ncbi:MAG: motility protein A [Planctomycetota bacterium]|jgi:flagellar motor component MotA
MDIATLIGFIAGMGLIIWAIMSKSDLGAFADGASVAIVLGGAVAAAMISFPLGNLMGVMRVVKNAFFAKPQSAMVLIKDLVSYAEVARRDGILSLENVVADVKDPFIVSGIQMAVDGTDPDLIQQIMTGELESIAARHETGKALFENLGKYAPAAPGRQAGRAQRGGDTPQGHHHPGGDGHTVRRQPAGGRAEAQELPASPSASGRRGTQGGLGRRWARCPP